MQKLEKISVIIPARDEAGCIEATIRQLSDELRTRNVPHEILVVDDGSTDDTWLLLENLSEKIEELVAIRNKAQNGFGRAVRCGLSHYSGDAVVIMMADDSDDCRDVVRYWNKLNEGYECVFGSRFIKGGGLVDYPKTKYVINRMANYFIRFLFSIKLNDTTNAFKAYRRSAIDGCSPLLAPHFNLTVELPIKSIIRGYSWTVIPITWRNRQSGVSKLKIREMGSRYFFIVMYLWLEKYFSRGDFLRSSSDS